MHKYRILAIAVLLLIGTVLCYAQSREPADKPAPFLHLVGHHFDITDIEFSPDGKTLASGSGNRLPLSVPAELALWDVSTGRLRIALQGHTGTVNRVAFSPDGLTLASAGLYDCTARLWDVNSGRTLKILKHNDWVYDIDISPDGKTVTTACADRRVRLWDTSTGRLRAISEPHEKEVLAVAFSPDGRYLASSSPGAKATSIRLLDPDSGLIRKVLYSHQDRTNMLDFAPNGRILVSSDELGDVQAWNLATGEITMHFKHIGKNSIVVISPDGKLLATSELIDTKKHNIKFSNNKSKHPFVGRINLWDMESGRLVGSFHEPKASLIAFSPDCKTIATNERHDIELWSLDKLVKNH